MDKLKTIINFLDTIALSIWGLTLIDLWPLAQIHMFATLDETIKVLMAFSGMVYFLVTIPHKLKMQSLERRIKKQHLNRLIRENKKDNGADSNTK